MSSRHASTSPVLAVTHRRPTRFALGHDTGSMAPRFSLRATRVGRLIAVATVLGAGVALADVGGAVDGLVPDGSVVVTDDGSGFVASPRTIELRATLGPGESATQAWVSRSSARSADGRPSSGTVASCTSGQIAQEPSGLASCTIPTASLEVGATYRWWFVIESSSANGETVRVPSAAARLTLGVARKGTKPVRRVTLALAGSLPSRPRFVGSSIKHVGLTRVVHETMRSMFPAKTLAVACWADAEFADLLASMGRTAIGNMIEIDGIWFELQPRWLHLAGRTCASVERVLRGSRSGLDAFGLSIVVHEALHANGIDDEAMTQCYAVQLVPLAARSLGLAEGAAAALGRSALSFSRRSVPEDYWDARRCKDGEAWDLPGSAVRLGA